uniref:ATP synthase mitochondrial F1 complex assembly factor 1 n=1 Tax=Ciona savignyi TaxID=51511 RepID=H2YQP8_CIOSA
MSKEPVIDPFLQTLQGASPSQSNMAQRYVRLFPILLGTSSRPVCSNIPASALTTLRCATTSTKTKDIDLLNNPFYRKYAAKIEQLKKTNPAEYEKRIALLKQANDAKTSNEGTNRDDQSNSTTNFEKHQNNKTVTQKSKKLDDVIKLDMVMGLPAEEIRKIWIERYANKDAVCAVISSQSYCVIRTICEKFPVFVYPLSRKDRYEMFVGQFQDNDIHFTSLINYQRHKEHAPSQLTLNHFTELEADKGIVLMSGQVIDDTLSVTDAQMLAYLVQHFCTEHPKLIRDFNISPQNFDINSVISALDSVLLSKAGSLNQ